MFFVPDNTEVCGYYECKNEECLSRFLSLAVAKKITCPYCGTEPDMELGPDDDMPKDTETAELVKMLTDAEEIEKMDGLLSLALTGGDYTWI